MCVCSVCVAVVSVEEEWLGDDLMEEIPEGPYALMPGSMCVWLVL